MLAELQLGMDVEEILSRADSGMPKLWVSHRALNIRRERPEWFSAEAAYTPLAVEGPKKEHLVAYMRGDSVAVLAPRWNVKRGTNWAATSVDLPLGRWENLLTGDSTYGGRLKVQALLQRFPVALFAREGA